MREVRKATKSDEKRLPLSVLVQHPLGYRGTSTYYADNLRGLLLDLETWAREGLIDAAVPAGYYRPGGTPEKAIEAVRKETLGKVDVWYFGWVPGSPDSFNSQFQEAKRLGAKQILFWEAAQVDCSLKKDTQHANTIIRGVGSRIDRGSWPGLGAGRHW